MGRSGGLECGVAVETGKRRLTREGWSLFVFLASSLTTGCAGGPPPRVAMPTNLDRPFVAGYHTYWTGDAWADYPLNVLDELLFFELELADDGSILDAHGWPERWSEMVARATDAGVQVVPTVSMHDPTAFETLFADAPRVERLVDTLLALLARTPGLSGLHLDVEVFRPVVPGARDGYTAFVARLADRMRAEHPRLSLSVFVLAFDVDDVYNERALGQLADFVVVQGYDFHSMGSATAGPVAPVSGWEGLDWEAVLDRFDGFGVSRRKMVMSVPLYGYEWLVSSDAPGAEALETGVIVPYAAPPEVLPDAPRARQRAEEHGILRDPASGSPYYVFRTESGWVQGWYEDSESLRRKYRFVRENGLGGIAVFPLAYGTPGLWEELREAFPGR